MQTIILLPKTDHESEFPSYTFKRTRQWEVKHGLPSCLFGFLLVHSLKILLQKKVHGGYYRHKQVIERLIESLLHKKKRVKAIIGPEIKSCKLYPRKLYKGIAHHTNATQHS